MRNIDDSEKQYESDGINESVNTSEQGRNSENEKKSLQDVMLDYLRDRYTDDTFTYVSLFGGGAGISGTRVLAKSEKYPDANIMVTYDVINGEQIFRDNYLYYKYEARTQAFASEILDGLLDCEYRLFVITNMMATTLGIPGSATFEEFILAETTVIKFVIITAPGYEVSDKEIFEQRLYGAFKEHTSAVIVDIHFPDNTVDYDTIMNAPNLEDITFEHDMPNLTAFIFGDENDSFDWR